jgi:hypothetical protein
MPEPIDPVLTGDSTADSIQGWMAEGVISNVGAIAIADAPVGLLGDGYITTYTTAFGYGDSVGGVLCDGLAGSAFEYYYRFLRGDALAGSAAEAYINIQPTVGFVFDASLGIDSIANATRRISSYLESEFQASGSESSCFGSGGSVESEYQQ